MSKRKKNSRIRPWFKTFLFFLLLIICGLFLSKTVFKKDNNSNKVHTSSNKITRKKDEEKTYKLSLITAGDALLHGYVYKDAANSDGTYDFSKQLVYVKDLVKDYDLKYYNQETIFGGTELAYSGYPRFNSPSEFGDNMMDIGFNMVSLATNHSIDKGEKGILNAYNYWNNSDILYNGIADSEESRTNYIIKEKNNIKYTLLSYTTHTNGLPVPSGKPYLVNTFDKEKVLNDINSVRDKVDVLFVAMHWGVEYTHTPTNEQREIAQFLADNGVDVIIGCHPHVIQPIEKIGDTVVYYSLGNFISNQPWEYSRIGLMGTLDITKTVKNGESNVSIDNIGGELIYSYYTTSHTNYLVVPFSKMTDEKYVKNYSSLYDKYKNIVVNGRDDITIAPLTSN